jgi:hypothetical protein
VTTTNDTTDTTDTSTDTTDEDLLDDLLDDDQDDEDLLGEDDDLEDDDDQDDDFFDDDEPQGSGRAWNGPGRPAAARHGHDDQRSGRGSRGRRGRDENAVQVGAVVAMLLDRVEAAHRLDRDDVADLEWLFGSRTWADQLARKLNGEFDKVRRRQPRRGLLAGLLSPRPKPTPLLGSASAALLAIEKGKRLSRDERAALTHAASRNGVVVLEYAIREAAGPRGRWDR